MDKNAKMNDKDIDNWNKNSILKINKKGELIDKKIDNDEPNILIQPIKVIDGIKKVDITGSLKIDE